MFVMSRSAKFALLGLSLSALPLLPVSVAGEEIRPPTPELMAPPQPSGEANVSIRLERIVKLRPAAGSEDHLKKMTAFRWSNGGITVRGHGVLGPSDPPVAFFYEVDPESGRYRTWAAATDESIALPGTPQELVPPAMPAADHPRRSLAPFSLTNGHSARVTLKALDPILCDLTRTEVAINWRSCTNGPAELNSKSCTCWAANPSCANTNWRVDDCWVPPADHLEDWVCAHADGSYSNWDFGDVNKRTWVYQTLAVCGKNDGRHEYWFDHSDGGEFHELIHGWVSSSSGSGSAGSCSTDSTGGGGGGGGFDDPDRDPDDGTGGVGDDDDECVPVYDGETDEYLGDCCGSTNTEIIDCAAGYLE